MKVLGFIAVAAAGWLLLLASEDFPAWGDPQSPANANPVSRHFITQSLPETSVPNVVTSVLADYRGYDTMFETVVIFIGGLAILAVLGLGPGAGSGARLEGEDAEGRAPPARDLIVVVTCRLIIPVIQLFALYVVAHGHYSPGGGFQGGVIFGASLILMALSRDLPAALRRVSARRATVLACVGVAIYGGIGVGCMMLGGSFLDYGVWSRVLPGMDAVAARSLAILGVEIGVAFTVASIMFLIYANLSSRGEMKGGL